MNSSVRIALAATTASFLLAGLPALAQQQHYSTEFVPAKLLKQGTTSKAIAGSGTVYVQVEVHSDGSHTVIRVIRSNNSGDNAAAMEIAQNSTYRPAHRGTTPITAFYDFKLQFHGKSVAQTQPEGDTGVALPSSGSMSSAAQQVATLIRAHQYAQARSKAQMELLSTPGDDTLRELLGVANYDANDFVAAAAAFDKVTTIGATYKAAAAQSFAAAAARTAQSNAKLALEYAQRAVDLDPNTNSRYALGVAQLSVGQAATAVASLKAAHDAAMSDPKIPTKDKVNIDTVLLQAYLADNDSNGAKVIADEIKQLDPSSKAAAQAMGVSYVKSGQAAEAAKDYEAAVKDYEQAAAQGDPTVSVTAYSDAAFAIGKSGHQDYKRMLSYADKAIALNPNDALANYAEGVALTIEWYSNHDDGTKKKAGDSLDKADQLAKAEGNEALALEIETFIKNNLKTAPAS